MLMKADAQQALCTIEYCALHCGRASAHKMQQQSSHYDSSVSDVANVKADHVEMLKYQE